MDIEEIAPFIAVDSPSAAAGWYEKMLGRCRRLGEMPGLGVSRPEVRGGLRSLAAGNSLILYRQAADGAAEIVRVVHGARKWQDLLDG